VDPAKRENFEIVCDLETPPPSSPSRGRIKEGDKEA